MQRYLLTAALLSALRPVAFAQHYLIATSAGSNISSPSPTTGLLFYYRDTLDLFARVDLPAGSYAVSTSPDGATVNIFRAGDDPGLLALDLPALTTRSFLSIPGLQGLQTAGPTRFLGHTTAGVILIDPFTGPIGGPVSCAFTPERYLFNAPTSTVYAYSSSSQGLCLIGPDFKPQSLATGRKVTSARLLDNNGAGLLLLSTWNNVSAYDTVALDLATNTTLPVPSLQGALPALAAPHNPRVWYAIQNPTYNTNVLQRYALTFAADGTPVFTPQLADPPAISTIAGIDDRYLYTSVIGYCSSVEGPVEGCPYGFTLRDAATLQPVKSFFTISGPNTLGLNLAAEWWHPSPNHARPRP